MSDEPLPNSEIILYQTEDGRTRIQCRFENETLWLTQVQIAELFQTTVANINLHLKAIFAEGEVVAEATIKSHLIVRLEGSRQVSRPVLHVSLPVILAVGFRVRSHRGTQFRQWAAARLNEYLVSAGDVVKRLDFPRLVDFRPPVMHLQAGFRWVAPAAYLSRLHRHRAALAMGLCGWVALTSGAASRPPPPPEPTRIIFDADMGTR